MKESNEEECSISVISERSSIEAPKPMQTRFVLTIIGLQVTLLVVSLDRTIIATSLPTIGSEFQAMPIASWVINSYALTFNAFQPLFSKLSDIFGRKFIVMVGMGIFLLGTVLCGVSKNMIMLIISRGVQGVGGASLFCMVYIIIADIVPLEKRGSYEGVLAAVYALASVSGPLVGGSLTDNVSWRWNFHIFIPMTIVATAILYFSLHLSVEVKQTFKDKLMRIDYAGNFLISAAATLFLLALNFGGQLFPWGSGVVITLFVLTGILIALAIVVEARFAKEPLVPPRLLKNQSVAAILLFNLFFGISFDSLIFYLPVYFQVIRGDSAMWSGIRFLPNEVASLIFSILGGIFITRFGIYRPLIIVAMIIITSTTALFSLFTKETSWSLIYGLVAANGVGVGIVTSANLIAVQAAVESCDVAVAIGLVIFIYALGNAIGVAISSSVLNSTLKQKLPGVIPMEYAKLVFQSTDYIRNGLPQEYFDATINAYTESMQLLWYILAVLAGLGLLSSLFIKHHPLQKIENAQPEHTENSKNHS